MLRKNLHLCFSKSSTTDQQEHNRPFLIKNYNTLYSYPKIHDPSPLDSYIDTSHEPDFATAVTSQRFFFSTPGSSNSITDSSSSYHPPQIFNTMKDSVAVLTESPDPYSDFRRSMQEMVDARGAVDVKANWDYLHELLLCYLALNPQSAHKFIVGAFADLVINLMSSPAVVEEVVSP